MDMLSWALDQIVVSDRRTSRRCCQAREQQDLLRVFRHVYVPTDRVAGAPDKWEAARRATALRIAAVARVLGPSAVFVGEAAAVLHGIDTVTELIDVHVCVPCIPRTAPVVLPPLLIPGHGPVSGTIPPAAVVRHLTTIDEKWILEKAPGVRVVDLATAGAMCAQDLPARSGSVVVSGLLRRMSSFDRFWEKAEASRVREEAARRQILDRLEELSSRRGRRRARVVIAAADAACESVPERVLLWVLKSGGFTGVHTQVHHRVRGRDYYVDFEVPDHRVALESDSDGKHERTGGSIREVHASYRRQSDRQKDLESVGLVFARFVPAEYDDPQAVIAEVTRKCGLRSCPRAVPALVR